MSLTKKGKKRIGWTILFWPVPYKDGQILSFKLHQIKVLPLRNDSNKLIRRVSGLTNSNYFRLINVLRSPHNSFLTNSTFRDLFFYLFLNETNSFVFEFSVAINILSEIFFRFKTRKKKKEINFRNLLHLDLSKGKFQRIYRIDDFKFDLDH